MSGIRYVKAADRVEEQIGGPPGRIAVARDVSVNESETFGASIGTFEHCDMEWTVLYDEYIYMLEGQLDLETKEGTFNLVPGDGIWLPKGTWMVYRAQCAKALIVVYPVNWRQIYGHDWARGHGRISPSLKPLRTARAGDPEPYLFDRPWHDAVGGRDSRADPDRPSRGARPWQDRADCGTSDSLSGDETDMRRLHYQNGENTLKIVPSGNDLPHDLRQGHSDLLH